MTESKKVPGLSSLTSRRNVCILPNKNAFPVPEIHTLRSGNRKYTPMQQNSYHKYKSCQAPGSHPRLNKCTYSYPKQTSSCVCRPEKRISSEGRRWRELIRWPDPVCRQAVLHHLQEANIFLPFSVRIIPFCGISHLALSSLSSSSL